MGALLAASGADSSATSRRDIRPAAPRCRASTSTSSPGGNAEVRLGWVDLASSYRALVRQHFLNTPIVADRFHLIRLVHHHFLACWRDLDPAGSGKRGLLSLMRRHRHNLTAQQQAR